MLVIIWFSYYTWFFLDLIQFLDIIWLNYCLNLIQLLDIIFLDWLLFLDLIQLLDIILLNHFLKLNSVIRHYSTYLLFFRFNLVITYLIYWFTIF